MRPTIDDDPQDPQLVRLDNMLMAEGVAGPERTGLSSDSMPLSPSSQQNQSSANLAGAGGDTSALEHSDYRHKLTTIRNFYHKEIQNYEEACGQFTKYTIQLLKDQAQIRPISEREINRMVHIIRKNLAVFKCI